jgi:hypothetical protein
MVIVERRAVPCSSMLNAVDICFKMFYVLDINYPWECANSWDFMQKVVFGLGEGKGKGVSNASVLQLKSFLTKKE